MILRMLIVFAALLILGLCVTLGVGSARWRRTNEGALASLGEPGAGAPTARHHEAALRGLPEPVVRYFRRVLREGQPMVRRARFEQVGTFLTRDAPETWSKFTATEEFAPTRRGFVWLARIHMAPGLDVYVRDSYLDGTGRMRGELLRVIPVVDMGETPERS